VVRTGCGASRPAGCGALARHGTGPARHGTGPARHGTLRRIAVHARAVRLPLAGILVTRMRMVSGTARGARSTSSAARCASASTRLACRSSSARYLSIPRRHGHPTAARLAIARCRAAAVLWQVLPPRVHQEAATREGTPSKHYRREAFKARARHDMQRALPWRAATDARRSPTRTSTRRCSRARRTRATAASKAATTCSTAGSATARARTTRAAARR
jgi:hypothetical protein